MRTPILFLIVVKRIKRTDYSVKRGSMKKLFFILLALSTLIGCKNDQRSGGTSTDKIDTALLSQSFKSGSYWIYKNDSTSKLDCTFISQAFTDYEYSGGQGWVDKEECIEMFYYVYVSNTLSSSFWQRMIGSSIYQSPISYFEKGFPKGPFIYSLDTADVQNYFNSLQVGSNIFYKIEKATIDSTQWYSAKSIGIVKKIISDSNNKGTWNLIRWKVVK